jgi:hypothetical protein
MMKALLAGVVLLGGLLTASPASATQGCVTHAEVDAMTKYLSVGQVASRWETNGWYIGAGDARFRRGYPACWSSDRIVVVWYRYNTGWSDDWAVRDA